MPNWCETHIRVKGRKDCVEAFIDILYNDYDKTHFYRVLDVYEDHIYTDHMWMCADIICNVAWSVMVCMMTGPFTYRDVDKDPNTLGTDILTVSRDLNLDIQVTSAEPRMGFKENYMISKGELVSDNSIDYNDGAFDGMNYAPPTITMDRFPINLGDMVKIVNGGTNGTV